MRSSYLQSDSDLDSIRNSCDVFILDYDSMCSETDFTQEKSHFHPTSSIPNSSLLFAADLSIAVTGVSNGMAGWADLY